MANEKEELREVRALQQRSAAKRRRRNSEPVSTHPPSSTPAPAPPRKRLRDRLADALRRHARVKTWLLRRMTDAAMVRHAIAAKVPQVILPRLDNVTVAITASCNQRCLGCNYERGFMAGAELPLAIVRDLIDDASALGARLLRLYGGEPLLHPELPAMVRHALARGLRPYVTTNGVLLSQRIDELVGAGLTDVTIGIYGVGDDYDRYSQRPGQFARLERSLAEVRRRHGGRVSLRMNWLLMQPTCSLPALDQALALSRRFDMPIQFDLLHYSLPYFNEGKERELAFTESDRERLLQLTTAILHVKECEPARIEQTPAGIRSIPDWLILGAKMRVPCDKYRMIWVGADGTVQLCYVAFELGNLHEERLRTMLFGPAHRQAARDCFALSCPNCHCGYDDRVQKHWTSRQHYS